MFTFHNVDGGWYLRLDLDAMAAEHGREKNGSSYTFYIWDEQNESAAPLFTVYSFTERTGSSWRQTATVSRCIEAKMLYTPENWRSAPESMASPRRV